MPRQQPKSQQRVTKRSTNTTKKRHPRGARSSEKTDVLPGNMTTASTSSPDPVYFWRETEPTTGYLSQWYPCAFSDETNPSIIYPTAEHYMMYQKALLFNDRTVAAQILSASHPRQVKALGRKVSNFSDDVWHAHREEIVRRGNMLKFTRPVDEKDGKWEVVAAGAQDGTTGSKNLRELLLATGDREIVEASPMDRIWGIGFGAANAGKVGRERWGLNLLGRALMAVREELRGREGGEGKGEASVDGVEKEKTVLEKVDE